MKKQVLILAILFSAVIMHSQNYFFERDKKDTTRWRAASVISNKDGSFSTEFSPLLPQDSAVMILVNIKYQKIRFMQSLQAELSRIDTTLKSYTGKVYEDYVSESVKQSLAGNWEYVNGNDTMSLTLDKNMKLTGGKVKATVQATEKGLTITGIEKDPVILPQKDRMFTNGKIKFYKI